VEYMQRLIDWLKGGNLKKVITKVEVFTRGLEYQRRDLEKQQKDQLKRAKKARKEGNDQMARMYMTHKIRTGKWIMSLEGYRMNVQGILTQLKTASNYNDMAKHVARMAGVLNGLQKNIKIPKITGSMQSLQQSLNQFDIAGEFLEEGMDESFVNTEIKTGEIDEGLAELDAEIGVETHHSLKKPASGKVSKLEEEIRRLKGGN